jgi:hypothetical protein
MIWEVMGGMWVDMDACMVHRWDHPDMADGGHRDGPFQGLAKSCPCRFLEYRPDDPVPLLHFLR